MTLSWNQIKLRAEKFAQDWADATYEKGETQSFYNEFFEVFGIKRRSVARYEEHVKKLNNTSGYIDLFWPSVLLVEHKSAGSNLAKAAEQAGEYFDAIPEEDKPRYQLVCDFQNFSLLDRDDDFQIDFKIGDLPNYIEHFSFVVGIQKYSGRAKIPLDYKASDRISEIHKNLLETGYPEADLEKFLTRLVFCLFADNTGIFHPRGCFHNFLESRTNADGTDIGTWLSHLFQVLNSPAAKRQQNLDPDLSQFPYINGKLFEETISIPSFDSKMRNNLLTACEFDWSQVSPAIFGSLFQSVLSKEQRREFGGHSTSESVILKTINELFLSQLTNELKIIKGLKFKKKEALEKFQTDLSTLKFFDPACGCGNFIAIAYRELRRIEHGLILELKKNNWIESDASIFSKIDVDQFYGIEIRDYSARIAETAMWMTDHIANNQLSLDLGVECYRIPLKKSPKIVTGDALAINWEDIIDPQQCTFILGNPPYKGAKQQTLKERETIRQLANLGGSGGTLDLLTGWIFKASIYAKQGVKIGFVTTNSIIQGEQSGQLWPELFEKYELEIEFAHQAFSWDAGTAAKAHVQVVILGLAHYTKAQTDKILYEHDPITKITNKVICQSISPYLISGDKLTDPHIVIKESKQNLNTMRRLKTGTKPIDGGYYILTEEEKSELIKSNNSSDKFIRPFIGGKEFLQGVSRYILVLDGLSPKELSGHPKIISIIEKVRQYRKAMIPNKAKIRTLAKPNDLWENPKKFHITAIPEKSFLVIPEVSSERRHYVPIAWIDPPCIPSNLVKYLENATLVDFAFLTSAMHMAWLRRVGGTLEGRYRYSIQLVYNTFPIVQIKDYSKLEKLAKGILDARNMYPDCSLEELYNPELMPTVLENAHKHLDNYVDKIYLSKQALNDQERLENLLQRYVNMLAK